MDGNSSDVSTAPASTTTSAASISSPSSMASSTSYTYALTLPVEPTSFTTTIEVSAVNTIPASSLDATATFVIEPVGSPGTGTRGLADGTVAGIAVAMLAVGVLVGALGFFCIFYRRQRTCNPALDDGHFVESGVEEKSRPVPQRQVEQTHSEMLLFSRPRSNEEDGRMALENMIPPKYRPSEKEAIELLTTYNSRVEQAIADITMKCTASAGRGKGALPASIKADLPSAALRPIEVLRKSGKASQDIEPCLLHVANVALMAWISEPFHFLSSSETRELLTRASQQAITSVSPTFQSGWLLATQSLLVADHSHVRITEQAGCLARKLFETLIEVAALLGYEMELHGDAISRRFSGRLQSCIVPLLELQVAVLFSKSESKWEIASAQDGVLTVKIGLIAAESESEAVRVLLAPVAHQ